MKYSTVTLFALSLLAAPLLRAQDGDIAVLEIKPHPSNPLGYDKTELTVKKGQKVKLTLNNSGSLAPQPHNFVLVKIGKLDAVGNQANLMMTDPQGASKGYIPTAQEDIIIHTKLVMPKGFPVAGDMQAAESDTIEFTAPSEAGDYPYLCTFPGHWLLMRGVMHVTE